MEPFKHLCSKCAIRKVFLQQLKFLLPHTIDKWIVGGAFNMVEEPDDRRGGRLTSIHGQELAQWERLIFHLNYQMYGI